MFKFTSNLTAAGLLAPVCSLTLFAGVAQAQTTPCYVTNVSTPTAPEQVYDPFAPGGLPTQSYELTLKRYNGAGGGDTRVINFYLTGPLSANGTEIIATSATPVGNGSVNVEGLNLNIYHDVGSQPNVRPTTNTPSSGNRFLKVNFTGNNANSDYVRIRFNVKLPANIDVNASTTLSFDGHYGCFVQGGQGNGTETDGDLAAALVFPIKVLSALQASFAGTALDFGEIGDVDDAAASGRTTGTGNYVRVQSSGAYTVSLASTNGFRLLHPSPSANPASTTDRVRYSLTFLGSTVDSTTALVNGNAITRQCVRAGLGAMEDRLPLLARLQEGGAGKTPSQGGTYKDTLTVTFTPAVIGTTGGDDCSAFSIP